LGASALPPPSAGIGNVLFVTMGWG